MKLQHIYIAAAFCFFQNISGQNNTTLVFSYDQNGNVKERKIQITQIGGSKLIRSLETDSTAENAAPKLNVYPNPASSELFIEGTLPAPLNSATLTFLNSNGQIIKTEVYQGTKKSIDVTGLANGIYLLEVTNDKKQLSSFKIIISK